LIFEQAGDWSAITDEPNISYYLRVSIFEEFGEGDESEEEDEDEDNEEQDLPTQPNEEALRNLILSDFPDDQPYEPPNTDDDDDDDDEDEEGMGVRTSQLRHFVIQVRGRC
jgi:hypothetical protein